MSAEASGDAPAPAGPGTSSRPGLLAAVAVVVLLLDQLTKTWAQESLSGGRTIDLVGSLRFNLVYNPGGAFSVFGGGGWGPLISVLAVGVLVLLLWQSRTMSSRLGVVSMGLVMGGAVGNLVDRAFRGDAGFLHGEVIDFIDLQWWPVFNVADMGVVCGAIGLFIVGVFGPDHSAGASGDLPLEPGAPGDEAHEGTEGEGPLG